MITRRLTQGRLYLLALLPAAIACLIAAIISGARTRTSSASAMPPLRGEEAVTYLKEQGTYSSLGEAMAAAERLGIDPANRFLLGYPDRGLQRLMLDHFFVPYRSRYTNQSSVGFANAVSPEAPYEGRALDADLRRVIDRLAPTHVFVASPLDAHPDHSTSGEFVMRILGERNQLDRLYYWIIHGGFDWPRPRGLHRDNDLVPPERARDLPWLRFELTRAEQDAKLAALQAHRTQMEIMRPFLRAFVRRNELFTRVPLAPEAPIPILTPDADGQDAEGHAGSGPGSEARAK